VIGRALRDVPSDQRPFVFTKCGMVYDQEAKTTMLVGDPQALRRDAERSLRVLGVETLDLLQLHWPPQDDFSVRDAWATLVELRREGLARFVGVSNCDTDLLEQLEPLGHVDTVQPPLSLLAPGARRSILPWAASH